MTKLVILTSRERQRFDSPPIFNANERTLHFTLNNDEFKLIQELRTPTNKIGFAIQLGYFKANAKFYTADKFRQADIEYIAKMLNVDPGKIDLSAYQKKIPIDHRKRILSLMQWQTFNNAQQEKVVSHVRWLAQRQFSSKNIFLSIIDFCWQNKIELPSYNTLAIIITNSYNEFEQGLINILAEKLTTYHREKLDGIVKINSEAAKTKRLQRPTITLIKQINQSLKPSYIQENVKAFKVFKEYFFEFKPIIDELHLPDQATEYFATWVQKSTAFQLNQFPNRNKLYLYLLCYIKHQFYLRHDVLVDIFLKSVRSAINGANKRLNTLEKETRSERHKAIRKLSSSNKSSRELIEQITKIIKSPIITQSEKLPKIEALIDFYNSNNDVTDTSVLRFEKTLNKIGNDQFYFDALETMSIKLQRKVAEIVKLLEFNHSTSSTVLINAILYFKLVNGEIGKDVPIDFLNENEQSAIYTDHKLRTSLYKILLFLHMESGIKSGNLNLLYSYRYKAIHEYLINDNLWKLQRTSLLEQAGLSHFNDFSVIMNTLKDKLHNKYKIVNENFLNGSNLYLTIDTNGKVKIMTPKTDSDESEYVSSLLSQSGFVPILQVLADINLATEFSESFNHISNKHTKMKPHAKIIFAGILGKGCNIGINRIANISIGITEDSLMNMVNWCFTLKNLQNANNKIIGLTSKLFLSNSYRHNNSQLHTGSDGQKVNVAVDSLLANYSFKYFGKGKGVTMYTFLDERNLLFYSTVISSSEREAAYVIDGLLQNEVIKSSIHSTDSHGYSETIFAAMHFIGTAFAPRIKNISRQNIYAFSSRKTYEKRGYKILPSRIINIKLIEKCWDDVLRFMTTIKLKHTSASQLFKRLSSYAKDHPLYQAIKEFGRIIKSIFILTYFDDVELRQRVEKQLNKVELSNKFSKAVFFANNQEFKQGDAEEQKIATTCKVLIQNAIVLWNYLYLSQLLTNNANITERNKIIEAINKGSVISWQHINLQGEYDFTKHNNNDIRFDMDKILSLKAA